MNFGGLFQYRYVLLLACSVHMMIIASIVYNAGIYHVAWKDEFGAGSGATSWIGAVHIGILCLVAPVSSFAADRFGYRKTVLFGAVLASTGLICSAFAPNLNTLFVAYGIVAGVGQGITLVPASTVIAFHFKKRARVVAVGLVTSGGGVGSFVMPYVINAAMAEYGWRGSALISAGVGLNLFVTGMIIKSPPNWERAEKNTGFKLGCRPAFLNSGFILLLIHLGFVAAGISVVYIHICAITEYLTNVSREESNLTLSMIGLANLLGRLTTSALGHFPCTDSLAVFYWFAAIVGVTASILPFLSSYPLVLVWAMVFGFFLAPNTSLCQVVVLHFVHISDVNSGLALAMMVQCVGYVAGAPIAGALYDVTGEYAWSFYLGGGCILMGVLVFTIPLIGHHRQMRHPEVASPEVARKIQSLTFGSMILGSQMIFEAEEPESESFTKEPKPVDV